jgi:hypothetical protein
MEMQSRTAAASSFESFDAYKNLETNAEYVYSLRQDGNTNPIAIQQMLGALFDATVELKRRIEDLEAERKDA